MKLDGPILENSPLFHGLDGAALDGLMRLARPVTLKPGKTLFRQGDPSEGCYIILEGVLRWKRLRMGHTMALERGVEQRLTDHRLRDHPIGNKRHIVSQFLPDLSEGKHCIIGGGKEDTAR